MLSNHQFARNATAKISTEVQINQLSQEGKQKKRLSLFVVLCLLIPLPLLKGCDAFSKTKADAQRPPSSQREGGAPAVDVAIAKTDILQEPVKYPGSTRPVREVSLRSQVEGRILSLQADVGTPVKQGQILAQLDDSLLVTSVTQGEAELAALQSEVARAQMQVQNARAQAEQARAELKQAQVDAARLRSLASSGAIPLQQAEVQQTEAATAQQTLNAAIAQIATEQQAVAAAQRRVDAQRATIAQAKERQSYTLLASPITGVVVEKVSEIGNLVQPGGEVLRLGDFSSVKVVVMVSDLELSKIQVGTPAQVRLDAFATEKLTGRVTRISPAADVSSRRVPVEITIPNSNGRIGSGLLARVNFEPTTNPRVVVPETALSGEGETGRQGEGESNSKSETRPQDAVRGRQNPKSREATIFVVTGEGNQAKVQARRVQVGTSANGNVEILSGLNSGERFVVRSEKPLKDGALVRVSILSRTSQKQEPR
jgi:multidrug efflux pump subunit AcrA (membrane-fusion protein)